MNVLIATRLTFWALLQTSALKLLACTIKTLKVPRKLPENEERFNQNWSSTYLATSIEIRKSLINKKIIHEKYYKNNWLLTLKACQSYLISISKLWYDQKFVCVRAYRRWTYAVVDIDESVRFTKKSNSVSFTCPFI